MLNRPHAHTRTHMIDDAQHMHTHILILTTLLRIILYYLIHSGRSVLYCRYGGTHRTVCDL